MENLMEIFTLATGVIYIILEIRQKNAMWLIGVITSLAAMWVFFRQGLYASFGLNTYYFITAFIGLWQWKRDKSRATEENIDGSTIHLNRLGWRVVAVSLLISVTGIFALAHVMELLENPMSYMDSAVAVLSAVATWWLVKSYLQQWWLWVVADTLSAVLCAAQGMWWMTALYAAYAASAIYGYMHWKSNGRYIG